QLGYDHTLGAADTAVAAPVARPAASASAAAAAARPQAPAASSPPLVAPSAHAMGPRLTLSTDLSGRLSRYPPGGARTRGVAEARRVTLGIAAGEPPPDSRNDWPLVRLRLKAAAQASGIDIEQIDAQSGTARLRGGGHLRHLGAAWQLALQTTLDDFDPTLWWPGAVDTPWQRGPHRLAGELQAELSLTDRALAASPDTLARLANLSGQTRLRLRSSVLAGVPVAGTLDLQAGAPMATPLAAVPASNGPLDGTTHPRVQVTADISVGERALSDSGMNPGGVGLTLRGQLDPLGRDDRWQLGWQARSLEALAPWLRLAGIGLALDGDVHGELEASGRWPQLRSHGRLTSEHLLTRSRPVIEPDSTAAARTTSLALDNLHASWTVGSAGSDPLSVDLSLDRLNAAGISGAEFHGVQLAVRGSGAAHQLSLRSRWVRTPAAPPASGTNGGAGGNASPGGGSPPRAGATASGVRPAAVAAAAGRTAGAPASSAEPDSVVPRHWLLAMDATGGWSSTPLAALATTLGDGRGTAKRPDAPADSGQVSWQGRIDQLLLNELVIDANGTPVTTSIPIPGAGPAGQAAVVSTSSIGPARAAPTATATSAETRAVPRAPVGAAAPVSAAAGPAPGTGSAWVIGLAPTSLGLGFGGGETRVQLGPTRLRLAELSLAIDGFSWRSRAAQAEPDIELRARIEPLNVAPLLARAQPGFGWRGDLQLGGRLALQSSADAIDVDIELARLGGDLVVIDPDNPAGPQRLDLRQFKLALQGRQGVWTLSEQVDGANLGSLVGQQTVRSASAAQWPGRLDPVAGQLDLQVAQLGNWGRWLPAGWRLSGRLTTQA
ncbi:MAG: hypothetical protein RLZZ524_343, partial [Pseudomonadota bacterium]